MNTDETIKTKMNSLLDFCKNLDLPLYAIVSLNEGGSEKECNYISTSYNGLNTPHKSQIVADHIKLENGYELCEPDRIINIIY